MSFAAKAIEHKKVGGVLFASIRSNVMGREDVAEKIDILLQGISAENILGPAIMIRNFMHSYPEGMDVEVGFPVNREIVEGQITTRQLPEYEVLAREHSGGLDTLGETYQAVFGCQSEYGLITDEFCIEILHDNNPHEGRIEIMMVLHDWHALFGKHLNRVMGEVVEEAVMEGRDTISLETSVNNRFEWVKGAVDRFDQISDDFQRYEVISSCSHVFPRDLADKMRVVYQREIQAGNDMYVAVDAVISFMDEDPGWAPGRRVRDGNIIYITKRPSNPEAYEKATTDLERKKACCFCPIIRENIDQGMSPTFCYCSSGFERKQWEVALSQPVKIDVVKSLLKGNMQCQFAVHLPQTEL
jgi:hypothetical protein